MLPNAKDRVPHSLLFVGIVRYVCVSNAKKRSHNGGCFNVSSQTVGANKLFVQISRSI